MPARPEAWPRVPGCVGPGSRAVWNRLSLPQVDTVLEAVGAGFGIEDIAQLVCTRRANVVPCLIHHRLLARAIANGRQL